MVMVALLAAIGAGLAWPAEPLIRPSRPVDQAVVNPEGVVVSLDPETVIEQSWPEEVGGVPVTTTQISAVITADSPTDAVLLYAEAVDSQLTFSDETVSSRIRSPSRGFSKRRSSTRKDLFQSARQAALGPAASLAPPVVAANPFGRAFVAKLPANVAERHKGEPVTLDATVTFRASQYRVRGAIPARPSARFAFSGSAIEITAASVSPTGAAIGIREANVRSFRPVMMTFPEYYLRNAARHEAFPLEPGGASELYLTLSAAVSATTRTWLVRVNSYAPAGSRIDAAWLAGAELVCLELEDIGTFTRPLHAGFTLKK